MPITPPATPDWPTLRKRLEYVTTNPAEWRQLTWGQRSACGTVACLAGGIVLDAGLGTFANDGVLIVSDPTALPEGADLQAASKGHYVGVVAAELLGLDPLAAAWLWAEDNSLRELWTIAAEMSGGEIEVPAELPPWADVTPGYYDVAEEYARREHVERIAAGLA